MKGEISTTQKIYLRGYTAQPPQPGRKLWLGTCGSYGTEELELCPGPGWAGLTLSATFHPPGCQPAVRVLADQKGRVSVPPEATASASLTQPGRIVFAGLAEGVQRISCNLLYYVADHAEAEGPESKATPSVLEQALVQMNDALKAAQEAVALAQEVALRTPQISANDTWMVWDNEAGAYRDTGVYAGGKAPVIGENKNWFVGGVDTGICAEGKAPVLGVDYLTEADMRQLTEEITQRVLPTVNQNLAAHNTAPDAHSDLRGALESLTRRVQLLESSGGAPTENPFTVYFNVLDGLHTTGVWDAAKEQLVF